MVRPRYAAREAKILSLELKERANLFNDRTPQGTVLQVRRRDVDGPDDGIHILCQQEGRAVRVPAAAARSVPVFVVIAAVGLGALAASVGQAHPRQAMLLCLLPLTPLLVLHNQVAAVTAIALLPYEASVVGGAAGGLNVSASDLMLSAAFAGLLLAVNSEGLLRQRLSVLRPMFPLLAFYVAAAIIVTSAHPSLRAAVKLVQRVEVIGVPLLVGALVLTVANARRGFALFIMAATVLGLRWLLPHGQVDELLGVQKNPAGQYVADAALVSLSVFNDKRIRFLVFPFLVIGVYATESRGALVGLVVGLVVFTLLRSRDPLQFLVRALPVILLLLGVYSLLPASQQGRIRGNTGATTFSDNVRKTYAIDARRIIREHKIIGVGIGNYSAGDASLQTETDDPHNIILLETAEGGAALITAFIVLQLGGLVVVFRRRHQNPWALAAIVVQSAILAHSLLDIYWVRGTPVPGFLLIGLALAAGGQTIPTSSVASATGKRRRPARAHVQLAS
jgi:hypothetical protein